MKVYQGQIILAVISEQREEIYLLMKILHFAFSILHLINFYLLSAKTFSGNDFANHISVLAVGT